MFEAATVADAERLLDSDERFDALLVDARLPGSDGLDLLERTARGARAAMRRVALLPMDHRVGDLSRCEAVGAAALASRRAGRRWSGRCARGGAAPAAMPGVPGVPAPSFAGRRILLVEDAPENRVVVQAHLRATGCDVEVAVDGEQAVEAWRQGEFDLVLMDLHMPRVDGAEAARRIRAEELRTGRRPTAIVARHRRHRRRAARRLSRGGLRRATWASRSRRRRCFA